MVRPLYYDMDGLRLASAFNIDRYRSAVNYKPQADDIFIVTYPKCGTTWLQEICYLILNDGVPPANHLQRLIDTPFLEMLGAECVEKMRKPGAIKTHLPFNLIPFSPDAKYVCAIRNPKDCVVSFFYHTSKTYPGYMFTDGTFPEFFELFMNGQTDYGCYFKHLRSWYSHRRNDEAEGNIHFICFEDLKKNPAQEVLKLARFLGEEYAQKLEAGLLDKVLDRSSLKTMQEGYKDFGLDTNDESIPEAIRHFAACNKVAEPAKASDAASEKNASDGRVQFKNHVRKGAVNDWKNHFTPEMNRRMDERIIAEVQPEFPELVEKWRQYGVFDPLAE